VYQRQTRVWLLLLLIVTVLFSGGALVVKYRLELLRSTVEARIESRTGAEFQVGAVEVNGLRGLRIEAFEAYLQAEMGPTIRLSAPRAEVDLDILDLFSGRVTIDRIQLDGATALASRPREGTWFSNGPLDVSGLSEPLSATPFRIVGTGCTLSVENVVGDTRLMFGDLELDVSRLSGANQIDIRIAGNLGADASKRIKIRGEFTSFEDFDLAMECAGITAEDVNVFLPASQRLVEKGRACPNLRVTGYPNRTLIVWLDAPFQEVALNDEIEFLQPETGTLMALASYNLDTSIASLTTAKIRSIQADGREVAGTVDGEISFAADVPEFDLHVESQDLLALPHLDALIHEHLSDYGSLELAAEAPCAVELFVRGTSESPEVSGFATVKAGEITLPSPEGNLPSGRLKVETVEVRFASGAERPEGTLNVADGVLEYEDLGVRAERISGAVRLADGALVCDPLSATITGNPFVGSFRYEWDTGSARFELSGEVADVEKMPFMESAEDLTLAGPVNVRCRGSLSGEQYVFEGEFDGTQAQIGFEWWFRKPPGIAAYGKGIEVRVTPRESIDVTGALVVGSTPIDFAGHVVYARDKWLLSSVRCDSGRVDVPALGKCMNVPYMIAGGTGTDVHFLWERKDDREDATVFSIVGRVDDAIMTPNGGMTPLHGRGIDVSVRSSTIGEERTGEVVLAAEQAYMPPFGDVWFLPLNAQAESSEEGAEEDRSWSFSLSAATIDVPPWQGTEFVGQAYDNPTESGLSAFSAEIVGGGSLKGRYRSVGEQNVYALAAEWNEIPCHYLIKHLRYDDILEGTTTGRVDYSVDRDDPGTLRGDGRFTVRNGQFSADFLLAQFGQQLENDINALPPSLRFRKLEVEVGLEGDRVRTPRLFLDSEGIDVSGAGEYVRDGDLDYQVRLKISPETTQKIPLLREAFNVEGHRLAQQDVELAFRISGPTFDPRGELAEMPPLGVTLVSGALEVTSEALKVIDMPRRILVDLLKTGTGVVSATR